MPTRSEFQHKHNASPVELQRAAIRLHSQEGEGDAHLSHRMPVLTMPHRTITLSQQRQLSQPVGTITAELKAACSMMAFISLPLSLSITPSTPNQRPSAAQHIPLPSELCGCLSLSSGESRGNWSVLGERERMKPWKAVSVVGDGEI